VLIVATSAVREAANGREFAAALERVTGEPVRVVTGEEEAALTLAGVLSGLGDRGETTGEALIFDVGGGSTEYILAHGRHAAAAASLRLGVVDFSERYPFPGLVDWPRYRTMQAEVAARLVAELPPRLRLARPGCLVGTAGTATTLAALDLGLQAYDPERVQGHALSRGAIDGLLARLGALTVAERGDLPCLEPGRADLILAGTAIVLATMDLVGAEALIVSDRGLREGILIAQAAVLAGQSRLGRGDRNLTG
jgi:exopolyphosphatase/guanosine-5'-triphosphate,3'-diphosphate pyrophosphatase